VDRTARQNGSSTKQRPPDAPTDLPKRSWRDVLKRAMREFREDDLTLLAAALTYYSVLSLFPALLVLISILGLIGSSATQPLIDNLGGLAPGPARDVMLGAIRNVQNHGGSAGFAFVADLLGALGLASS
jgi:membrane protein